MSNIGLDFGTTYSVIAAPRNADAGDYTPNAKLLLDEDYSPFYDSLVLRTPDGIMSYGRFARGDVLKNAKGIRSYKGFKLLLDEDDESVLAKSGYKKNFLPDDAVRDFIADLLTRYTKRYGTIENLVIGVPEIWVENSKKQKCYERLFNIVTGLNLTKDVILLSEPACACAYYVSKYKEQRQGEDFTGNILIVDYGGGTLDIALCQVENNDGKPKVTILKRSGAGANEEGIIGKAGFAFMEEIVRLALTAGKLARPTGESEEEKRPQPLSVIEAAGNRNSIYSCIYQLEDVFKAISSSGEESELKKNFYETFNKGLIEKQYENESQFSTIKFEYDVEFGGRKFPTSDTYIVDYGMIARAFGTKILPVLNEQLDIIIKYMEEHKINYKSNSNCFKIQLIGGFCNCLLVRNAVDKRLVRGAIGRDKRYIGELPTSDDRTMAVAYGAALLANEQTDYGFMSQYSLGVPTRRGNTVSISWAIEKDTELVINKIYLFKAKANGVNADVFGGDGIASLVYEGDYGKETIELDIQYSQKLKLDPDHLKGYIMGISQDRSRILTCHWWKILDPKKIIPRLGELESLIEAGTAIDGLDKVQSERLNNLLRLGGDGLIVLRGDLSEF